LADAGLSRAARGAARRARPRGSLRRLLWRAAAGTPGFGARCVGAPGACLTAALGARAEFCCNGTVVEDTELGHVIQLQGDQRKNVSTFLTSNNIANKNKIKVHGADRYERSSAPRLCALCC
jgi:hypothetical protein